MTKKTFPDKPGERTLAFGTTERRVVEHALGFPTFHRTHYAAANGTAEFTACERLAERGLMEPGEFTSYGRFFFVTEAGALAAGFTPKDYARAVR